MVEQALKEKKITIRLSENLYNELKKEADEKNIKSSEYVRWKLENRKMNTEAMPQTCRFMTTLNTVFSRYDIKEEDKKTIGEEAGKLWQLFN